MPKANVRFFWDLSPDTAKVTKRTLTILVDGVAQTISMPSTTSTEYVAAFPQGATVTFKTTVEDDEGTVTDSAVFTLNIPAPDVLLPDTNLGAEIIGIIPDDGPAGVGHKKPISPAK
jgi:hypothetical protein